jgi:hypothetical protein
LKLLSVLNLCRLIYSFETRNVVISKAKAAEWGREHLPQWRKHIELAGKSYEGRAEASESEFLSAEVDYLLKVAQARIAKSREAERQLPLN